MKLVLVTGAAGFIGSHVVELLLSDGWHVRGVDALTDSYDPAVKLRNISGLRENPSFTLIQEDLTTARLGPLVEGVDAIVHLAAEPGVSTSWGESFSTYVERNVLATQRLLEAAASGHAPRVVYASSSSVYGPTLEAMCEAEPTGSAQSLRREQAGRRVPGRCACPERAVPTVSLRFFSVYGPRQRPDMAIHRFTEALLDGREVRCSATRCSCGTSPSSVTSRARWSRPSRRRCPRARSSTSPGAPRLPSRTSCTCWRRRCGARRPLRACHTVPETLRRPTATAGRLQPPWAGARRRTCGSGSSTRWRGTADCARTRGKRSPRPRRSRNPRHRPRAGGAVSRHEPRMLIYSQDGLGLGHMRRTSLLAAEFLRQMPGVSALTLSDSPLGQFFATAPGHDFLKLPSIRKSGPGEWEAVSLSASFRDVLALRRG